MTKKSTNLKTHSSEMDQESHIRIKASKGEAVKKQRWLSLSWSLDNVTSH